MRAFRSRRSIRLLSSLAVLICCPPAVLACRGRWAAAAMNLGLCAAAAWGGQGVGLWSMAVLHAAYVHRRAAAGL